MGRPSALLPFAVLGLSFLTLESTYKYTSATKGTLRGTLIPRFVEDLHIPIVLYDARVNQKVKVSLRQISQQILPSGFPKTKLWAYGNPDNSSTFSNPAGTIETTDFVAMEITWTNELIVDPDKCRSKPGSSPACNYLVHVVQDKNGVPIVDQTLHWAAPNQECKGGARRTDCRGNSTKAYKGPVPMTAHVHGAHVEYHSDGFPESWFLPNANNITSGYAKQGRYYATKGNYATSSKGSAVYNYDNSDGSATLFYHDHTLGMTRLNAYASGAGFWIIREMNDSSLPGPPPVYGQNPNSDMSVRKKIREIPVVIQQMSFYDDGRLFYPANRVYQANSTCSNGDVFGDTNGMPKIRFLPNNGSDLSPIWNPEAFFDTWVVNGKTWPKFEVAPERYRFRFLNFADSASLNIFLKTSDGVELPIYIIASGEGFLPNIVSVRTGEYSVYNKKSGSKKYDIKTTAFNSEIQALLIDPGERYDVIVDFSGLLNGTEIIMHNTAPDGPFQGFDSQDYAPANVNTTGMVMKFIVRDELKNPGGDKSSLPWLLQMRARAPKSAVYHRTRDLVILEADSKVCVDSTSCDASPTPQCDETNSFGPIMAMLGYGRKNTSRPSLWSDPICMNPKNGTTEIVHLWNWTPDAHPIHIHLVRFQVLGRFDIFGFEKYYNGTNPLTTGVKPVMGYLPYEYMKDTAIAYPNTVTQLWVTFDRPGLYVLHCHILSHEDNEMMLPYCIGKPGVDCPAELFVGSNSTCTQ